jgi:hypothetical protein
MHAMLQVPEGFTFMTPHTGRPERFTGSQVERKREAGKSRVTRPFSTPADDICLLSETLTTFPQRL